MKKLLIANYKMNGNKNFFQKVNKVINKLKLKDTVILCPPFVYMPFLKFKNKNVLLCSQDITCNDDTKSTGQISASMLKEFDVKYSIVGHSERRAIGETDEIVAKKIKIAQDNNITPIICVGEKTKSAKLDVLLKQVETALSVAENKDVIFAYEPVWAIGTGEQPAVNKINKVINLIKTTAKNLGYDAKVLYGGSVNASNYKQVLNAQVDGLLMGGVSLKIEEFTEILRGIDE